MASLGENIALYRRKKGLTQEALGEAAGVSMQAVSKWENGGLPDATLLPAIAKTLGVSIDALFGMDTISEGVEQAVARDVGGLPKEERIARAFELCWVVQRALFGITELEEANDVHWFLDKEKDHFSQVLFNSGISLMEIDCFNRYFFLAPEPQEGWSKRLQNREEHIKLFALLAHPDVYDLLAFLYRRDQNPFTVRLIEKQLAIPPARSREILTGLAAYKLVKITLLELDDETIEVFSADANPSLIGFLTFANELCARPMSFSCYSGARERPYFRGGCV